MSRSGWLREEGSEKRGRERCEITRGMEPDWIAVERS